MSTHLKYCLIWTFPAKLDKPFSNTSTPTYRPYRIDRLLDHVGPFALRQGALFHRWYPGASKSPADFDRWGSCLNSKSFDDSNPFFKALDSWDSWASLKTVFVSLLKQHERQADVSENGSEDLPLDHKSQMILGRKWCHLLTSCALTKLPKWISRHGYPAKCFHDEY